MASSTRRTYLISERFDRIGAHGRRHVVSIGAAHAGFIATGYNNWSASCEQLARQNIPLLPPAEITDDTLTPILWELLHNLSLLFERTFNSVQDLNRYRKEIAARLQQAGAAPQSA